MQSSTTHADCAAKHFEGVAAEVKIYQTQDEAFQDLAVGRIDASQADRIAVDAFLASETGMACCDAVGAVADDPEILGAGAGPAGAGCGAGHLVCAAACSGTGSRNICS